MAESGLGPAKKIMNSISSRLFIYFSLIKAPLSLMNAGTAFLGYSAAIFLRETATRPSHLAFGGLLFLVVFLLSGGAAALNNYQDRHIDSRSPRTFRRPIPARRIAPARVLMLSIVQIAFSLLALTALSGRLAASAVALAAVVLYNGLYTPLKKRTLLAFLPGLLSGSLPPVIGWLAADGPLSAPVLFYMITALFLWQLPHFWLLLLSENPDSGGTFSLPFKPCFRPAI